MHRRRDELHLGPRFQIVERGRARRKERLALAERARTNLGIEKAPRFLDRVRYAIARGLARARYPHRAGRSRSRAADLVGLLAEENIKAFKRCDKRSRHAAHAGAEDQNVNLAVPFHAWGEPAGENSVTSLPLGAA